MTTKQADQLIRAGKPIKVRDTFYQITFTFLPVSRDRWNIRGSEGQVFDRGQLQLVA